VFRVQADSCPYLAGGVRLFWDEVRGQWFLLFPEGALVLNRSALAILERCNKSNRVSEIIAELSVQYPSSDIEGDVFFLLSRIADRGLLLFL
jgi:pyrroloquinoline quinone biosynthesis protein D